VNDYFLADKDDYRSGTVRFAFHKLPKGEYVLKLKIGDTYNNLNEGTLRFRVGSQITLVKSIIAYPNPFVEKTNLQVELANEGEDVEIQTQIFDLVGKIVRTQTQMIYNSDKILDLFTWDGTNHFYQVVPTGTYIYRVLVHSLTRQQVQIVSGKLVKPK
jgi:flagellar hook assembly protein FlgD